MAVTTIFSDRFLKATQGLNELMHSYPGMEMGHHLMTHLYTLSEQASVSSAYPIEILLMNTPDDKQLFKIFDLLHIDNKKGESLLFQLNDDNSHYQYKHVCRIGNDNYAFSVYNSNHLPIRSTSSIIPCLKLLFWFGKDVPDNLDLESIFLRLDAEAGIVCFIHEDLKIDFAEDFSQLKLLPLRYEDLPKSFDELIELLKLSKQLPVLHGMRLLQGLEKLSEAFYQYISQQEKDIKTKKFNAQQDINAVKIEEKLNLRDLFQQLKMGLQRSFAESERGIADQLVKLGQRYNEQSLMGQVEEQIQAVSYLQEENFAGSIRMRLPSGTIDNLKRVIFQGLRLQIEQQIFSFKEFLKQETEVLTSDLKKHHIDFIYHQQLQINLSRIEANMIEYVQFTQKYEVEKKPLQLTDYIRAATAPFMTVMSVFLLTRFIPPLKKLLNEKTMLVIGVILIPIALYSFYMFLQNTKKRKIHDYTTELNRMRESLLSESKGIVKKFTDEWQRELVSSLREELNAIINCMEVIFAQVAEEHKEKIQQAQRSVQRRVQGLEQRERAHQTAIKNKETFDRSLAQFKGELMQVYYQNLQQL